MICSAALADFDAYVQGVTDGSILACESMRGAVARHVADLERVDSDDAFTYRFDRLSAELAIEFYPIMLRHSVGDFEGEPFRLEPFQAFIVGSLFGWKRLDGSRRFRRAYVSMARKNGKTALAAGIAQRLAGYDINPTTLNFEGVAEVILAATKTEQAYKVLFAECERMRGRSEELTKRSEVKNRQITFHHNGGSIRCVASDKSYDGLNPHGVILDELHAWTETHRNCHNTLSTGSGSRTSPLMLEITTAGDDRSYLWISVYQYARNVAVGTITDDQFFSAIWELDADDDPFNPDVWIKANPNLGVSVKAEFLETQSRLAKSSPLEKLKFLRYHGNRCVAATTRCFDLEQWRAGAREELSDWSTADAVGAGVDLGGRNDFCAFALCARFLVDENDDSETPLYRYEMRAWAYIANDSPRDLRRQPFAEWIETGQLIATRFPIREMEIELIRECDYHGVYQIAFDPHGAQALAENLAASGFVCGAMRQSPGMFHEPITEMLAALADGRLTHSGDPVLEWCANNATIVTDRNSQVQFCKRNSAEKIDPIVAAAMAFRMAMCAPRSTTLGLQTDFDAPSKPQTADELRNDYLTRVLNDD